MNTHDSNQTIPTIQIHRVVDSLPRRGPKETWASINALFQETLRDHPLAADLRTALDELSTTLAQFFMHQAVRAVTLRWEHVVNLAVAIRYLGLTSSDELDCPITLSPEVSNQSRVTLLIEVAAESDPGLNAGEPTLVGGNIIPIYFAVSRAPQSDDCNLPDNFITPKGAEQL